MLVLRADRMGDVSAHPVLARLVERGLYVLAAMTPDELRAAIEGPARQAGLIIEPGLVDLLVREVEHEPGALPLLSHALRETWLRREGRTLTVAGYQASGGIRGAVAQSAESLYGDLEPGPAQSLHDLLLRLVSPGPRASRCAPECRAARSSPDPAGRARRPARADPPGHQRRRRRRDRARGPRPRLATAPRLARGRRRRTTDPAPPLRHRRHLGLSRTARPASSTAASASPRPWSGGTGPTPSSTPTEREFLDASAALAEAEERADRRPGRSGSPTHPPAADRARRRRGACCSPPSPPAGSPAYQQNQAEDNAAAAVAAQTAADARAAGARALVAENIDDSLLQAVAGARLDESSATRANLQGAIDRRPAAHPVGPVRRSRHHRTRAEQRREPSGGLRPPGCRHPLRRRQLGPARRVHPAQISGNAREQVAPMAFSPDGATLAVGMPAARARAGAPLGRRNPRGDRRPAAGTHWADQTMGRSPELPRRALDLAWNRDGTTLAALFRRVFRQGLSRTGPRGRPTARGSWSGT